MVLYYVPQWQGHKIQSNMKKCPLLKLSNASIKQNNEKKLIMGCQIEDNLRFIKFSLYAKMLIKTMFNYFMIKNRNETSNVGVEQVITPLKMRQLFTLDVALKTIPGMAWHRVILCHV